MMTADVIVESLPAGSKKRVFHALAREVANLCNSVEDDVFTVMIERERLGSTGIGFGAAIPHVKIAGLDRMYGILARLEAPVDYDAIDAEPVDIIFTLVVPDGSKTTSHLKTLAQAARFLKDDHIRGALRTARDKNEISGIFTDWLQKQAA